MKGNSNYIKYRRCVFWLFLLSNVSLVTAQFTNTGTINVLPNTDMGVYFNYANISTGIFTNDGNVYLYQNWHNDGTVSFSSGSITSNTYFIGVNMQSITGTGTTNYYNVVYNNSATGVSLQLQKEVNIYGDASYIDGIIQESNLGLTIFQDNSTHSNVSNNSYVDGKVRKVGNDAFTFPIGDDNSGVFLYRMAAIEAPSDTSDSFDAQYIWQNSNDLYVHSSKDSSIGVINDAEYWTIERTSGSSSPSITIGWNVATTPANIFTDASNIIVVRWDGNRWVDEGGIVDISSQTITTTPLGYGVFTLATKEVILDSDGDGVTDEQELSDNTDSNDMCSFIPSSQSLPPSVTWLAADCDGDGISNEDEDDNNNNNWSDDDCDEDDIANVLDPDSCTIMYPDSFSPNGDGINDTFVIPNLEVQYPNFILTIYNRYGNVVYKFENNGSSSPLWWDGRSNGRLNVFGAEVVPAATYWYVIDFNDGRRKPIQKWLYLNK